MSSDPLYSRFEQLAGLQAAAENARAPEAGGAPLTPEVETDARKLAEVCLRLRAESTLTPAADLWDRLQERVRLYQASQIPAATEEWENLADVSPQMDQSVPFSDLFDLCAGTLDDSHAGSVERRIATSPEAQKSLRVAGQLSAVLNELRSESELRATTDAYVRFEARVVAELAQPSASSSNLSPAIPVPMVSSPATVSGTAVALEAPRRKRRARPRVTWFSLAACLALAFGIWHQMIVPRQMAGLWPFATPAISNGLPSVANKVEQTQSLAELKQLAGPLASWVAESVLSLEEPAPTGVISPATMANWHLAADLSNRPHGPFSLETVKFLVRQAPAFERDVAPGRAGDAARQPFALSVFSVAHAADEPVNEQAVAHWPARQVREALRIALKAGDFDRVAKLCNQRTEWDILLVRAWSLAISGGEAHEVNAVLAEVESARVDSWPMSGQVFLAGLYRTVGQPAAALSRLESMVDRVPELAFHIGQIYDRDLNDESQAAAWYAKLDANKLLAYRNFGLAQTKLVLLFEEKFGRDLSKWERGGVGRASFSILPEYGGDVLHQTEIADLPNVGYITTGSDAWKNYEIRMDFRFNEAAMGDPQIGVFGYFNSEEENYRVAIGRESLGFRRRESRSWGGYETISWPKMEPRYPTLSLGVWYTLRFRLENVDGATRLAAKVWLRDGVEPEEWLLVSDDVQASHYTAGRIGLMISNCRASIANVRVVGFGAGR